MSRGSLQVVTQVATLMAQTLRIKATLTSCMYQGPSSDIPPTALAARNSQSALTVLQDSEAMRYAPSMRIPECRGTYLCSQVYGVHTPWSLTSHRKQCVVHFEVHTVSWLDVL